MLRTDEVKALQAEIDQTGPALVLRRLLLRFDWVAANHPDAAAQVERVFGTPAVSKPEAPRLERLELEGQSLQGLVDTLMALIGDGMPIREAVLRQK